MNAKHTPGKLISHEMQDREEITIGTDDFWIAEMCLSAGYDQTIEEARANAARLVACWNACDGMNPKAVPALLAALKELATDADRVLDLVEAEGRDTGTGGPFSDLRDRLDSASAALALAEGGAT